VVPEDDLLSGTVTFLFTDIEGSTGLLKRLGRDEYETVLAEHAELLRAAVAAYGGRVVDTQGDSLFCAFPTARAAVSAATDAQRDLALHVWPEQVRVRVRMGLHSSEPKSGGDRYVGIGVHRAARIGAAAHGGQILVSETARALVADDLPAGVSLRDLGVHRLKDIDEPLRLYHMAAAGLDDRFPPPRTLPRGRSRRWRLTLAAAAALMIAAATTAGLVLATGSSSAKPVRLVANSLGVLDPKSGKPVGSVPLGFAPTSVTAGGDKIWVLNWRGRTAVAIDPSRLEIVQTVGIAGDPDAQYAAGGKEWIGVPGGVDELDGDGATHVAVWRRAESPTHDNNPNNGLFCNPSMTGAGQNVYVAEGPRLAVIDAASGSVLRTLALQAAPNAGDGVTCYNLLLTSSHRLYAVRFPDLSFGPIDLTAGTYTPVASNVPDIFGVGESNWAAGFGSLWLANAKADLKTNRERGVLSRFDLTTGDLLSQTPIASAGAVTTDPATGVWVVESLNGTIVNVDPQSGQVVQTFPLNHVAASVDVGHGRVWIGIASP
jgi:class 3 adenylate cyclase